MPLITLVIGVLLVITGGIVTTHAYSVDNNFHFTATIPAIFGIVFVILGALGLQGGNLRKHAMHAAAGVSLLGVLGGAFMPILGVVRGTFDPSSVKAMGQMAMTVMCATLLALCVNSFVQARRARTATEGMANPTSV